MGLGLSGSRPEGEAVQRGEGEGEGRRGGEEVSPGDNSTKGPTREGEKNENCGGRVKKSAKFWAPRPSGPHPSGPHPSGPHFRRVFVLPCFVFSSCCSFFFFEKEGQKTETPIWAKVGLAKVGPIKMAKVGLAKVGISQSIILFHLTIIQRLWSLRRIILHQLLLSHHPRNWVGQWRRGNV